MGSKCSKVGMEGIIQPTKRVPEDTKTVVIASKNNKRGSIASGRLPGPGERTADTVKSPDFPSGTATKPRSVVGELTSTDTYANNDNLNDTYPTTTPTTADTTSFKRLFQYKKGPLIGKGTYGDVYECLNLNSGELLAVKSFKIRGDPFRIASYIEALRKEVSVLKSLHNINIVRYYSCEITEDKEQRCSMADIILEYVSGGSVRKLLDKFGKLEEKVVATYTRQILEGLAYLHLNDIVHRNLKGSNILIDTTGTIKLTDFGCSGRPERFSEENPQDQHRSPVPKSSAFWSAPEVIMRKSQGKPSDMWSVGCVIIEMLTGEFPWKDHTMEEFTRKITSGAHPPLPEGITESCKDFLLRTFKFDPDARPSPLDLLEHAFVRDENHETSYMEAESIQTHTFPTFSSGARGVDLGNAGGENRENRKYLDLKSNNFTRKQIGTNVSMSNINLGRVLTSDFAQRDPYSQGPSGLSSMHNSVGKGILDQRNSLGNLHGVREAQYEDEQSPEPGFHNQLYKFGRANTRPKEEENLTKEEKRRRLEAEMEKELLKVGTGNLENPDEEEEDQEEDVEGNNVFHIRNEQERQEPYKKSIMPAPIKNSLFSNDEEFPKRTFNEMGYSTVNMNISEYKTPMGGHQQQGSQPGFLGFTGAMWDSRHLELKNSAMSKISQEDKSSEVYDGYLGRGSTGNMAAVREDVSMQNSETETAKKERLRRQFEEQMEVSLQRVNSEKYYGENPENSEMSEDYKIRGLGSSVKKHPEHPEEEVYNFGQVLPRFSTEEKRDTWKNEESTSYIEKIQGKKFEEDLVGVFRGVWDGQAEGMDLILRRDSNQLFDPERRTSDPYIVRYNPEDSKSTQEPFSGLSGFAGQRSSPEGVDYEKDSVYEDKMYQDREEPQQQQEVDQEKLGIINEAEELKEDSWNQSGTFRKRRNSQEIY